MEWKFEPVAGPFGFTEGTLWTGSVLLFTDIPSDRVLCFDPLTGACREWQSNTNNANGLALDGAGHLYAAEGRFDPLRDTFVDGVGRRITRYADDGTTTVICADFEGKRFNSPNDLAVDTLGRLWFTDSRYGDRSHMELDHESVYRLDPGEDDTFVATRVTFDTTRPNGLAITPDNKTLYVAQSDSAANSLRELRAYPIDKDGFLGAYEVLHNFGPHRGIDGMCLDTELNIVAAAGSQVSGPGPMIYVFSPSGRVLEMHPFPFDPTNCTFGEDDLRSLFVASKDGYLYRALTSRRGCHR